MDKKILLGGAAALLLVGNMYATPASAAIEMGISGEAEIVWSMGDTCGDAAATSGTVADAVAVADSAHITGDDDTVLTYINHSCTNDEDNPVMTFGNDFDISASGTLANGLSIDYSNSAALDDFSLTLGGAFGSLKFAPGLSAVDEAAVGDTSGADVTTSNGYADGRGDFGGHKTGTDGAAGNSIVYQTPAVGGVDLFIGWAPNSTDSGDDGADYLDTFSFAAVMGIGDATVMMGYETADATDNSACGVADAVTYTVGTTATVAADTLYDSAYGGSVCGDQNLLYVGGEMGVGDMTISAAYSDLDSDEADQTTISVGVATAVGEWDVALGYANTKIEFLDTTFEDEQTVIDGSISTALGDGVDLGINFSTNEMDLASQALGDGATNNYYAAATLTVGF